jgi:cyanophycinase
MKTFDKILSMFALVGSGEYLPPMEPVDRFLLEQLPDTPRVVCLPTAAGTEGEERISYWSNLGKRYFSNLGVQVEALPVIDRTSAEEPEFASAILQANFVYFSGGRPDYLLKILKGSLVWQAVEKVQARGGQLAGCSAGAMILGERVPGFPLWRRAFSLLPGAVVIPHYDEIPNRYTSLFKLLVGNRSTLVGVEGNTALFVKDSSLQVVGLGGVTLWNRKGKQRFTDGQVIAATWISGQ